MFAPVIRGAGSCSFPFVNETNTARRKFKNPKCTMAIVILSRMVYQNRYYKCERNASLCFELYCYVTILAARRCTRESVG